MLTKQLEEATQIKKKIDDMNKDLQKQLKNEREENKRLNKKIQLQEADLRRANGNGRQATPAKADSQESMQQEVLALRKDLETAERIAKQSSGDQKNKELQLKRAMETVSKLKSQVL